MRVIEQSYSKRVRKSLWGDMMERNLQFSSEMESGRNFSNTIPALPDGRRQRSCTCQECISSVEYHRHGAAFSSEKRSGTGGICQIRSGCTLDRTYSCADFPPPMTMMGATGTARGSTSGVQERRSSIRDLKCIECNTGPENWANLAAAGVNGSG